MFPLKATNEQVAIAYKTAGSVKGAGKLLGMCGQSVHERLVRLGIERGCPRWTKDDDAVLTREYMSHRNAGTLNVLAAQLRRTKPFICRQARRLGLTDQTGPKPYMRVWMGIDEATARKHFESFKRSRLGLGAYCIAKNFDDLGFSRAMRSHFPDEWDVLIESKIPRQTKYRLGRHVEYSVRDALRRLGYFVLRSPRSGGPVDLVAIKLGRVLLVQCKRSMDLSPNEWNQLFDLSESVGAIPILAGRPSGYGIQYKRLVGRKDGSRRRQPMTSFSP